MNKVSFFFFFLFTYIRTLRGQLPVQSRALVKRDDDLDQPPILTMVAPLISSHLES